MNIIIENLFFGWQAEPLLKNVNCRLTGGEMALLQGDNGSGKTTLLKLAAGMIPHFSRGKLLEGDILLNGRSIIKQAPKAFFPKIAYLPSRNLDFFLFNSCLEDDVTLSRGFRQLDGTSILKWKETLTGFFPDLPELWTKAYATMSQGQKMSALMTLNCIQGATLFLLDEVFKQIPPADKSAWLKLFEFLKSRKAVIIVTAHEEAGVETCKWILKQRELVQC